MTRDYHRNLLSAISPYNGAVEPPAAKYRSVSFGHDKDGPVSNRIDVERERGVYYV